LHILQLASRFPPLHTGGIENVVWNLSRGLVRRGHEVTVLTSSDSWERSIGERGGVRVWRLPCPLKLGYTSPLLPSAILESLRVGSCEIVHAHIPDGFLSSISSLVSMAKSSPLVLTLHNLPLGETPGKLVLGRILERSLGVALHLSSRVFIHNRSYTSSPALRWLRRKTCITPLGVDLERFNPAVDGGLVRERLGVCSAPIILFVGVLDRAHWYKGLRLLLRSMGHLDRGLRDARLVVVGSGDALQEYRSYAGKIGVGGRVIFTGYVEDRLLPYYYASSDLVVLPSISMLEGVGLTIAEAMASGKAALVSRVAGISSFLTSGDDALILRDLGEYALAEAISELLQDDRRRRGMGRRARETAESLFDWAKITERILEEYGEIVDRG